MEKGRKYVLWSAFAGLFSVVLQVVLITLEIINVNNGGEPFANYSGDNLFDIITTVISVIATLYFTIYFFPFWM